MTDFLPTECDIVMEGGVTSGVVYPTFVAKLASRFTLRSIGGTSVGAVAAIAAAAAQFARNRTGQSDGFQRMERISLDLQEEVDGKSRLFSLFQPCPDLRRHFAVITGALNRRTRLRAFGRGSLALMWRFPLGALAGIVAWSAIFFLGRVLSGTAWNETVSLPALVWLSLSALACVWTGALSEFLMTGWTGLRRNRCGICSGMRPSGDGPPALTEWLHELVQGIAGLPADEPLTFGHLEASSPSIELALMTTGLSEGHAVRLPHSSHDLVFRASEFRQIFPREIVDWMVDRATQRPPSDRSKAIFDAADAGRARDHYYLPEAGALPILVAARMSLSFPGLLQAVPLLRIRDDPDAPTRRGMRRVWFSDGGLTSNFPIHFFDSPLPTRPTFGVTLAGDLGPGEPEEARVFLPSSNNEGIAAAYLPLEDGNGNLSPLAFGNSILQTIRTWRDTALKRSPGYRDRVVQIRHTKAEGGLNLDMPKEAIERMRASGTLAAVKIIDRFLCPDPARNGWLNHRWVRMRSTTALLQGAIKPLHAAMVDPDLRPSYQAMWLARGKAAPGAYPLNAEEREAGRKLWEGLVAVDAHAQGVDLSDSAPRPEPSMAITPKQN
ncbi:patatin-like phospholipase family protein [Massilia sp. 9096]|uniref:patatin-like phospholipase family protein n=1 Tax=Massilia sp. 9096 TaxID=1500894 RepID=UPI000564F056|nr:patatin-like phospholipase family protein [Massilia sp. 9096]